MSDSVDMGEEQPGGGGGFFSYIPVILWQRKWLVIAPFVVLTAAGIALALLLPPVYRSSATLLVESQELPAALVSSPMTSIIDQRIAKIREQVLSRGDLIELIEQNGLYEEQRRARPLSEVVRTMQKATTVEAVANNLGPSNTPAGSTNTIAFTMSFDYRDPAKAQAVMQSIVSRFLEIDATTMAEQANNTVAFLQDQSRKLNAEISQVEGRITEIKARNGIALSGGSVVSSNSGAYGVQIAQLQGENRSLMAQARRAGKDPLVAQAESALVAARAVYAESHPDVVRARARLAQAQEIAAAQGPSQDAALIQSQIQANNAQIAQLEQLRASESARAAASLDAQARGPALMQQIDQLDAHANALRQQLSDVSANVLRAQASARMAQEQKGERLAVVDPPSAPDAPTSPNRLLLIAGGAGGGLGLGLVLALLLEFVMRPVRGVGTLQTLGLETLSLVPTFTPDGPDGPRPRRRFRLASPFGWPFRRKPAAAGGAL